jgi:serine/threonine-protein kinase PknG
VIACNRPGCTGTIDETGFCDVGFHRPLPGRPTAPPSTVSTVRHSTVSDPLSLPLFPFPDPSSRIISHPEVPERERRCSVEGCDAPVGDSYAGQAPVNEGFCPQCGHPFSFLPNLDPGDLVADQYRVIGCFAHGGMGWVYLAHDTHLDDSLVVLKGQIDVRHAAMAAAERRALITMEHKNIVRILNFVQHPDRAGDPRSYIVMEYVDGLPLSEVKKQRALGTEQLRVEHVIACVLPVLEALEYLHRRGYLYCDLKPDNVIIRPGRPGEEESRIKLIDLGAVRRIDDHDTPAIGTMGFQVGPAEIKTRGLTVRSDMHTVGVTLHRLYNGTADFVNQQGGEQAGLGIESFIRLYQRARDPDADRRFASAKEMADQLRGVRQEIASLRDGVARPEPSTVFAPTATLLDDGLGAVPPLERWTRPEQYSGTGTTLPDGRPSPSAVSVGLQLPLVDPGDPAAGFLAAASAPDPLRLLTKLETTELDTVEVHLARFRALLELGEIERAEASLRAAEKQAGDWRISWHRGLTALARAEVTRAEQEFDQVYSALPGEQAPKLALAFCAEHKGVPDRAENLYEAVWRRDRSQGSAAFGLTRIRLMRRDRAGAVAVLDEVPKVSRHYDAAAAAAVIILSGQLDEDNKPTAADLRTAAERLPSLYLDGGAENGDARKRLVAILREAAFDYVDDFGALPAGVFGDPPGRPALHVLLERSYRALAKQARDEEEHGVLIDLANQIRPRTLL